MESAINASQANEPKKEPILQRLSRLFDPAPPADKDQIHESATLSRLHTLTEEMNRIRSLIADEQKRAESLNEELERKGEARVQALTDARLRGAHSDDVALATLELEIDATDLERKIRDTRLVAQKLEANLSQAVSEFNSLQSEYLMELAAFLDGLYVDAMQEYNRVAPLVAKAVLEVAAIRRTMIHFRVGNTNGWNGEVYLPGMQPKQGASVPPVLDVSSGEYLDRAHNLANYVADRVRAAGFKYKF